MTPLAERLVRASLRSVRESGDIAVAELLELALEAEGLAAEPKRPLSEAPSAVRMRKKRELGVSGVSGVSKLCDAGCDAEGVGGGVSSPLVSSPLAVVRDQDIQGLTENESSPKGDPEIDNLRGGVSGVSRLLFPVGARLSRTQAEERAVFDHWSKFRRRRHPRGPASALDEKRSKAIRARLAEGHTVETLQAAAEGIWYSRWHLGENDQEKEHTDIRIALRDAEQVEKFAELAHTKREEIAEELRRRDASKAVG